MNRARVESVARAAGFRLLPGGSISAAGTSGVRGAIRVETSSYQATKARGPLSDPLDLHPTPKSEI